MKIQDKLIKNTLFSGLSRIAMMAIGFFLMPYMITKLGKVEFGLLSIANLFMVTGYIALLEMGFSGSITKYVSEYLTKKQYEKLSKLLSSTLIIFLGLGFIFMIIGIFLSNIIVSQFLSISNEYHKSFGQVLWIVFLSYIFQFPNIILMSFLQGIQRFDIWRGGQTLMFFLYAVGVFILLQLGYSYSTIIALKLITVLAQVIFYFYFILSLLPNVKFRIKFFSWSTIKEIRKMTSLLWIRQISSVLLNNAPRILISVFLGAISMTYYESVVKLPSLLKGVLGFINSAIFPASSEIDASNKYELLKKLYIKATRYQFVILIPTLLVSAFLAKEFFLVWLGEEYVKLVPYFYLVLIWAVAAPFVTVGGVILNGMNRKLGITTLLVIISMILTILIQLLFISEFKLTAIFYGKLIGGALVLPFFLYIYIKELRIKVISYFKEVIVIFLIGVIPLIVGFGLNKVISFHSYLSLLIKSSLMIFIYWLVLYKVVLDSEDKIMIKKIIKKVK